MSNTSTISNQMPTESPAAVPRSRTRLLIRYPIATKTAPSMIEVPSMDAKANQLVASTEGPVTTRAAAAAPYPMTVANARIRTCPQNFPRMT